MKGGYSAVIAAAGDSSRFGGGKLKQKVGGKAVLSHSIDLFDADDDCLEVIVAVNAAVREWVEGNPLIFSHPRLKLVDGGATRARSVLAGVTAARGPVVAIHDAGRPNFGVELLARLKSVAASDGAAVPALPVADTLARVDAAAAGDDDAADDFLGGKKSQRSGQLSAHIDRAGVYAIQTPQFFDRERYLAAAAAAGEALDGHTDDSSIYRAAGHTVSIVTGSPANIKITVQADLDILLKLMGGGEKKSKDRYGGLGW